MLSACGGVGLTWVKPSSERRPHNQMISKHAVDMARYSASVDDLEMCEEKNNYLIFIN